MSAPIADGDNADSTDHPPKPADADMADYPHGLKLALIITSVMASLFLVALASRILVAISPTSPLTLDHRTVPLLRQQYHGSRITFTHSMTSLGMLVPI